MTDQATAAAGDTTSPRALTSNEIVRRGASGLYKLDEPGAVRPIVRWAGGKRWLLATVRELSDGTKLDTLVEPFLGGAAITLGLGHVQRLILSDANKELIEMYRAVRDTPDEVHSVYSEWENTSEQYYSLRASAFDTPPAAAARFLYLNHASFNGIYRVNRQGAYNVPFGRRKSLPMPTVQHLRAVAGRISTAELLVDDFEKVIDSAGRGSLIFADPPYTVAHNNNGFIKYNQHLFSFEDQRRLALSLERAVDRGAYFILTNAAHSSIRELFGNLGRIIEINRKNTVGGAAAARGRAGELLFTNLAGR